jgi:hypothetical protein
MSLNSLNHASNTFPCRKVNKLEFWEGSKAPGDPFHNVIVVAKTDRPLKRMMMDVYDATRAQKLASFFGM